MARDSILEKDSKVARQNLTIPVITATTITDRVIYAKKIPHKFKIEEIDDYCHTKAGTVTYGVLIAPQGTGVITAITPSIHSTPEQFALAAGKAIVGGKVVEKAAATALTFTAAHVVAASLYGIILIQMDNAGTVSTKVPSATQSYATAAAALAALPAADSGNVAIGRIAIANNAGTWTANTDDLTNGSDLTTATFTAATAITKALSAAAPASLTWTTRTVVAAAGRGDPNDYLVVHYTSDGSGVLTNGFVNVVIRPRPLGGEA